MKRIMLGIVLCVGLTSCSLLPITEGQVQDIATNTGDIGGALVAPIVNSYFPGAGPGAAGLVGGFITIVTAAGLNLLRKKNTAKRQLEILEVTKKRGK